MNYALYMYVVKRKYLQKNRIQSLRTVKKKKTTQKTKNRIEQAFIGKSKVKQF